MTVELDRIEKQIEINAPAERVWTLISEPGWFINNEHITEHRIEKSGDISVVHDPNHGSFAFRTVALDPPKYAAFRWLSDAADTASASTLVEFWIHETSTDSVTLRVLESGFASLPGDAAARRKKLDENTEGWTVELGVAKRHVEGVDARVKG